MVREKLITEICKKIISLKLDHPIKVAIDGVTASGKTTFADDIAHALTQMGEEVHRTSLDGFHNYRRIRYQKGRSSPEGYYFDAYNYTAIIEHLLNPLVGKEEFFFRTQVLDLKEDKESLSPKVKISKDGILIVDGSFSLREELFSHWDYTIYLRVEMKCAQKRAGQRDKALFGSKELAEQTTRDRYHAAHRIHNELEKPWEKADIVVDNNEPKKAYLVE
ncbi:hypothetical protein BIY24_05035 [Halobacteriovorax marinus]|uniref:uridine kinase n=1 Tax=Halobacteriovorax marinus TaxID=97084 RepID=UPI000BC2F222|nr:uridine kinase [Halobacteriovorax marinus]ATH07322.1 hypothetical protein BIY24_05035 [Halobacteriovorax marinus]